MNLWDAAPLQTIIEEAGGTFTDWKGSPRSIRAKRLPPTASSPTKCWVSPGKNRVVCTLGKQNLLSDSAAVVFARCPSPGISLYLRFL